MSTPNYDMIAESVFKAHRSQVEVFESSSMKAKFGQSVTPRDIANLGHQIKAFEDYVALSEADGSLANLGMLPTVGVDVITAVYAQSLAPVLASVQPMDDEQGIIWAKKIEAGDDRAGLTAGQSMYDRMDGAGNVFNSQYPSSTGDNRFGAAVADGGVDASAATLNVALQGPIRPQTVNFRIVDDTTGATLGRFVDDGEGLIMGNLGAGTINYETGALVFEYAPNGQAVVGAAAGDVSLRGEAQADFEMFDKLPSIKPILTSMIVKAEVQALQLQYGTLQRMMMEKRFGGQAAEEFAADLVNQLTVAQNTRIVEEFVKDPRGVTTLNGATPTGISAAEHKLSAMPAALAEAEETIIANAGLGAVSNIVAGRTAITWLRSVPGFKTVKAATTGNVAVMGELDGIPVIRAAGINGLASNQIVCGFKGVQEVDAPVVVAPVLPLFMQDVIGDHDNALKNSKAAASLVAYKSVAPQYTTTINIV